MNVDEIIEKFGLVWLCLVGMSLVVLILWKRLRVVQDVLITGAMLTAVPVVLHAMILRGFLPIFARSDGTAVWHLAASYVWISSTVAARAIYQAYAPEAVRAFLGRGLGDFFLRYRADLWRLSGAAAAVADHPRHRSGRVFDPNRAALPGLVRMAAVADPQAAAESPGEVAGASYLCRPITLTQLPPVIYAEVTGRLRVSYMWIYRKFAINRLCGNSSFTIA